MSDAVAEACDALKERLNPIAAQLLAAGGIREVDPDTIRYLDEEVSSGGHAGTGLTFREVVETAWRRRSNMTAVGYHRAPSLWWDREVGAGWPFSAFVFGATVVEVQLDAFTGETQVLRADVAHQGGRLTQIETDCAAISRAFNYGLGWMLNETVDWNENGRLICATAEDYPIPGFSDAPLVLYIDVIPSPGTPAGNVPASGAESAVALAGAAREAVREAILAFGPGADRRVETRVPVPASPIAVLESLRDMSRQIAEWKAADQGRLQ
jgi:xanthine dehydrogenase molybdopterin-binding subunit B